MINLINAGVGEFISSGCNGALKLMGGNYDFVNGNFKLGKADFDVKPAIIT